MNRYLAAFSLGPVQSFIEAARRTRDLWAGSAILSDLVRTLAEELHDRHGASLIFPSKAMLDVGTTGGIGNKIVAVVELSDPIVQLEAAANVVQARFAREADACLSSLEREGLLAAVDVARFQEQMSDALELVWAWAAYPSEHLYAEAFDELQALLDGRKKTRAFDQVNQNLHHGLAADGRKLRASAPVLSSLDGLRESVLRPGKTLDRLRRRYQINSNEELDALGLIKRSAARGEGFASITRIALQPWLQSLSALQRQALSHPLEKLKQGEAGLARGYSVPAAFSLKDSAGALTTLTNPLHDFAYDCEALLASRRAEMRRIEPDEKIPLDALEDMLSGAKSPADEGLYVCMLMADGDRLGEFLQDPRLSLHDHERLSTALARFAGNCHAIAARNGAACVYAGGDDVLALSPVDAALQLARELADEFAAAMASAAPPQLAGLVLPTLSVGLAFAHAMHPLGELRHLARRATQLAKQGRDGLGLRNALGVLVVPRGGSEVSLAGQWNEILQGHSAQGLDGRLLAWRASFANGQLSRNAAYSLRELSQRGGVGALPAEAARLVGRRFDPGAPALAVHVLTRNANAESTVGTSAYKALADEWYVGRWLASHSLAGLRSSHSETQGQQAA